MKLFTIKIFISLVFFLVLLFSAAAEVNANVPDVIGQVVTSTGAPVSGVWVKWTDGEGHYRYDKTDGNGNYFFISWDALSTAQKTSLMNTNIDTNLDGSNDTNQANDNGGRAFSCLTNKHAFSVVRPVGMTGNFSTITNITVNNGNNTIVLSDMIFTSTAATPTPSPTFTPTPTLNPLFTPTPTVTPGGPTPTPPGPTSTPTPSPTPVPTSTITGRIFIDTNLNGTQDGGESAFSGGAEIIVTGTSYARTITDGAGNYSFPSLFVGSYTVYVSIPNNYSSTTSTNVNVTIAPGGIVNYGIVPSFSVIGNIFNDINKNLRMDSGETVIPNAEVDSTGGTFAQNNGIYEIQDLKAGTYTITYITPLPNGFYMIYPKPPSFQVTVGPGCITDTTTGAVCSARGDITDLNFSVSDSWPWLQTYGLDLRFDNGVTNLLPASTTCGGGSYASGTGGGFSTPGINFTGDSSADFGQGSASSNNWVVGGISYPEVFKGNNPLKTSTQSLRTLAQKAGIPLISLSSVAGCSNPATDCNLPNNLAQGVYVTNGDIRFRRQFTSTFVTGNTYVFITGNNSNMFFENNARTIVPLGATVIFSAGLDMLIDPTIRPATNTCPVPAGQLQGIFSADRHIIISGNNGDCLLPADSMLNIDGTLIINAEKISGKFQNQRDLCADNRSFPSLTIKARADFILNTPGFLTQQQTITYEETP